MKGFKSIDDLKKVLDVISKNLDTNMSEKTMLSFYNVAKDVLISSSSDQVLSIQKLYLDGTGEMIYDERSGLVLWDYILNENSLSAVKKAMKDNLVGNKQELIKEFSYTIGENYEAKVIGKGYYGTKTYPLLTNFVGMKLSEAQSWAKSKGVTLNIEYVADSTKTNNTIIEQNYPESKRIDLIPSKTVTIKVVQNDSGGSATTKVDCLVDVNDAACIVPNFVGKSRSDFTTWANGFSNMIDSRAVYEESD